jgi:DNA-directed RNA polymerase subunit RPC12/RpoP
MKGFQVRIIERTVEDAEVVCEACGWRKVYTHEQLIEDTHIWKINNKRYSQPTITKGTKDLAVSGLNAHQDQCPKNGKCVHRHTNIRAALSRGQLSEHAQYIKMNDVCLDCHHIFTAEETANTIRNWFLD